MVNIFITISRYLIILLMVLFTYCNFMALSSSDRRGILAFSDWQYRILLLIHFLAGCVIIFKTMKVQSIIFYLLQLAFFIFYPFLTEKLYPNINRVLLNDTCLFLCFGIIMIERLNFSRSVKQAAIILAGAVLSAAIPYLIDRYWDLVRFRRIFAIAGILMLSAVLAVGVTSYGARMSISVGGMTFQLSELVKITFVISMSGLLYTAEDLRDYLSAFIVGCAHILILVACRDLGSALIFFLAFLFLFYIRTNRKVLLFAGIGAAAFASVLSYQLFAHVRTRVYAWLHPWLDINDRGYQITQSLFAIGTGGLTGLGLYQGMPYKIPVVEKDFIISAISEEFSGIVAVSLVLICLGCFMQMMQIASCMKDGFYRLVSVGLAVEYIVQVFLTVGGAVKFIPSTGVTLPFVSYGGSSMISSFLTFALIQALYIIQGNEDEADYDTARPDEEYYEEEEDTPDYYDEPAPD